MLIMNKLNNKGQILVVFVIILPLLLMATLIFIKRSYIYYEKTKINNILNLACKSDNPEDLIKKNDKFIKSKLNYQNGKLVIDVEKNIYDNVIRIKRVCEEWYNGI